MTTPKILWIIFAGIVIICGILYRFTKTKNGKNGSGDTKSSIDIRWSNYTNRGYLAPLVLMVTLCAVLKLTDNKLGWWSFMTKDWNVFIAFLFVYIIIASAFLQDKYKRKESPFYWKIMVITMIIAVILALVSPSGFFGFFKNDPMETSRPVAQTQPPRSPWSAKGTARKGSFTKIAVPVVPAGYKVEWDCEKGGIVVITHRNLPKAIARECSKLSEEPVDFGRVENLALFFTSTDSDDKWFRAEFVRN